MGDLVAKLKASWLVILVIMALLILIPQTRKELRGEGKLAEWGDEWLGGRKGKAAPPAPPRE